MVYLNQTYRRKVNLSSNLEFLKTNVSILIAKRSKIITDTLNEISHYSHWKDSRKSGKGENLFGFTGDQKIVTAFDKWYSEEDEYDYKKNKYVASAGNFTQLVWAGNGAHSTQMASDVTICLTCIVNHLWCYLNSHVIF